MRAALLLALLPLAACAVPVPVVLPVPAPKQPAGLQRLIGQPPERVIALLGAPTLDRGEGRARVLQFARPACVLDVFLYPGTRGVAVTEAQARTRDGRDTDPGKCIEAQLAS